MLVARGKLIRGYIHKDVTAFIKNDTETLSQSYSELIKLFLTRSILNKTCAHKFRWLD